MDLSISRRRKPLTHPVRDNKCSLPDRVRVLSALRAPRLCACRDCDARQRRSARPGCRGEPDRESLFPREEFRERRSRRQLRGKTLCPHIALQLPRRRKQEAATEKDYSMMGWVRSIETSSRATSSTRRRTYLTRCYVHLSAYTELENDRLRSASIKAEVPSRVYWTNVSIDQKYPGTSRSEEHTSELQSQFHLVC